MHEEIAANKRKTVLLVNFAYAPYRSLDIERFLPPAPVQAEPPFISFDWLMSLTPLWQSTIFGVYYFAGALVGAFAFLVLLATGLTIFCFLVFSYGLKLPFRAIGPWLSF